MGWTPTQDERLNVNLYNAGYAEKARLGTE
jgi:hypothetical protein